MIPGLKSDEVRYFNRETSDLCNNKNFFLILNY